MAAKGERDEPHERAATAATTPPPLLRATKVGKDVSVGEYEPATGLTYVTRQRGRLHFNMGANAIKQAHAEAEAAAEAADAARAAAIDPSDVAVRAGNAAPMTGSHKELLLPHLRTGAFTGLALYPEEAYYLLQRGALVVYSLEQQLRAAAPPRSAADGNAGEDPSSHHEQLQPLSVAHFAALLLRHQKASLACLDVYVFLKDNKFHPRRHHEADAAAHSQPQHYSASSADSACRFAFDVWKSATETVYLANESRADAAAPTEAEQDTAAAAAAAAAAVAIQSERDSAVPRAASHDELHEASSEPLKPSPQPEQPTAAFVNRPYVKRKKDTSTKKRKIKRLRLVFRVVVCLFADAMPSPAQLTATLNTLPAPAPASGYEPSEPDARVPVKLAVVDADATVLFFEVG